MNKRNKSSVASVPAQTSGGTSAQKKRTSAQRASSPRRKNKRSRASRRKNTQKPFWRRIPLWALITGLGLVVGAYLFLFYYFFVGPFSFRWKAMYGEPDYPQGFDVQGLDISHYQERIDWEKLRNADIHHQPIRFVFIKATEGVSIIDENFNENFYQARQNDILRGAYHFFTPDVDAVRQAQFFLKQVHLEAGRSRCGEVWQPLRARITTACSSVAFYY